MFMRGGATHLGEDMLVRYLTTRSCREFWSSSADWALSAGSDEMRPRSRRNCSSRDFVERVGLTARGSSEGACVGVSSPMDRSEKRLEWRRLVEGESASVCCGSDCARARFCEGKGDESVDTRMGILKESDRRRGVGEAEEEEGGWGWTAVEGGFVERRLRPDLGCSGDLDRGMEEEVVVKGEPAPRE